MLPKKLEFKDTRQKICVPLAMSTIFRKKSFKLKRYSSCRYNERQLIDVTVVRHNVRTYRFLPADTVFYGSRKLRKKLKFANFFSQLSSCTLFLGAKSFAKSLETFTFDDSRAIWSKRLQTFCVANVAEESCTAEIIPVPGPAKT